MSLPPDPIRAGFTLFEVLVTLAVIALMTGVVLSARPSPSPGLQLNALASALIEGATAARHRAVTEGRDLLWEPDALTCDGAPVAVTFYADGTSDSARICLGNTDRQMRFALNVLSGRLTEDTQ